MAGHFYQPILSFHPEEGNDFYYNEQGQHINFFLSFTF